MARYRSERGQGGGGVYGRIKKALSKVEFEILFVMFAGVFYITSKYFLYRMYEYIEENKVILPDFKLEQ